MKNITIREIILFAAILVLGFFLFQVNSELNTYKEESKKVDEARKQEIKDLQEKSDSISENNIKILELIDENDSKFENIQIKISNLNSQRDEAKNNTRSISHPDSLFEHISRRYQGN